MKAERIADPSAFAQRALPYLLEDEARHNLIVGLASSIRAHPEAYRDYRLWLVTGDDGTVAGAALQTPPASVVIARPRDDAALAALAAAVDADVPGAVGAVPEVHRFAELRGAVARVKISMRIMALEQVAGVPAAPGTMRDYRAGDRARTVAWWSAFVREALPETDPDPQTVGAVIDRRLAGGFAGIVFWSDGDPVAFASYGAETPNGVRIGPVFTPPELRGRGYATALVAALSRALIARGKRFCFLFTDRANATANAMYERIGYMVVCDAAELVFGE